MNKHQKFKALQPIRLAVKGWAFSNSDKWPSIIARAEKMKLELSPDLHKDADEIIDAVREALAELKVS